MMKKGILVLLVSGLIGMMLDKHYGITSSELYWLIGAISGMAAMATSL